MEAKMVILSQKFLETEQNKRRNKNNCHDFIISVYNKAKKRKK